MIPFKLKLTFDRMITLQMKTWGPIVSGLELSVCKDLLVSSSSDIMEVSMDSLRRAGNYKPNA
jgi:hypothetical protein